MVIMARDDKDLRVPAFAYLRKSRDRREQKDPDVLRRHRTILLELVRADGAPLKDEFWFEEVGSGERIASRPEFRRLLALLKALPDCPRERQGGVLYCMDADRLARGVLQERGEIQELLIRKGILIRTPTGFTDLRDTDERLLHQVKGALAEWELGKYKDRVAHTRRLQVRQAQVRYGSVPYGYDWDHATKQPRPHPTEFPILLQMCSEAFHVSTHQLARKYGLPQNAIMNALRSPMICGWPAKTFAVGRAEDGKPVLRRLPREEWTWPDQEASYPKAMSRPDWERLQLVLQERRRGGGGWSATQNHWCRDVVRFPGHEGRVCLGTNRNGEHYIPSYRCRGLAGSYVYVARAPVHEAATAALKEVFARGERLVALLLAASRQEPQRPGDLPALTTERDRLRRQLEALDLRLTDPDTDAEDYASLTAARKRVKGELERTKQQLEALRSTAPKLSSNEQEELRQVLCAVQERFDETWALIPDQAKRVAARCLIEAVEVQLTPKQTARKGGGQRYERTVSVRLHSWLADGSD